MHDFAATAQGGSGNEKKPGWIRKKKQHIRPGVQRVLPPPFSAFHARHSRPLTEARQRSAGAFGSDRSGDKTYFRRFFYSERSCTSPKCHSLEGGACCGGGGKYQKMGEGGGGAEPGRRHTRQTEPGVNKGAPLPRFFLFLAIVCEARAPRREGGRRKKGGRKERSIAERFFTWSGIHQIKKPARLLGFQRVFLKK